MRTSGYIALVSWFGVCSACSTASQNGTNGGEASASTPYRLGQALVIGGADGGQLVSVDAACETEACQAVRERCGETAYADVVVDADGHVLDVLCFRAGAEIREIGDATVASASAGNNTVLVFDGEQDGLDVSGDVVLTGNNVVLFGQGADVSQIGGDLVIDKNNAIVRGVAVFGDVRIEKNNAQLSFTEIHGDLSIDGNNTTLAECIVHGRVSIGGVNTVLVQNRFATERALAGKNLTCNGNVGFDPAPASAADAGADDAGVDADDAGADDEVPVTCERTNGPPEGRGRP